MFNANAINHYSDGKPRLCYKLLQTRVFSNYSIQAVYTYLASHTYPIRSKQADIAHVLNMSVRTFQRAINELTDLGLITRKYTTYKRAIYSVVTLAEQLAILANIGWVRVKRLFTPKLRRGGYMTRVSQPTIEISRKPIKELQQKRVFMSEQELQRKKDAMINDYCIQRAMGLA